MIQVLQTIVAIIISIFAVCIYFRVFKRAFDAFAHKDPFPYDPFASIGNFMTIQVGAIVFALFLGSPIIQFTLKSFTNQLIFISVIIITIGVLRLINIIKHDYINHDIVVWSCVAIGVLSFAIITIPDFIDVALSEIILIDQPQFQRVSLMLFIGTFLISIFVEGIGWLYKKISVKYGRRS